MWKRGIGLWVLLLLGLVYAWGCTDPVAVEHTTSSGNHTTSSGNLAGR